MFFCRSAVSLSYRDLMSSITLNGLRPEGLTIGIEMPYQAGGLSVHWPAQDGEGCARLLRGLLA